ncbi:MULTISPECIES: hypothetical protein [unclassified Caballeronia]|uniref:hypothetical protein n=1 Tax=unclassified Caballeronia TaxID=2646786 RepID=UPI00285CF0ED|nr:MULTISPECIES: hypothetical protein [unclassified Caballeronia]MDR5777450.1 hypothetical protein [Caballeronia sp. LZ002]MDR5852888.1 hypothetical protein [Caballeronia sp. LZ003]
MVIFHRDFVFEPVVTRRGTTFIAAASIFEEDGHRTSLKDLGVFASESGAYEFSVCCAMAFLDGEKMPLPPIGPT